MADSFAFLPAGYSLRTVADDPALTDVATDIIGESWPTYVLESGNAFRADMPYDWFAIYTRFPHLQFVLFDERGAPVACGNSLPLAWDDDPMTLPDRGWTWAIHTALAAPENAPVQTQCALSISVLPDLRGKHLSALMVQAMRVLGRRVGLRRLIAPVRPGHKARYPLATMEQYVRWPALGGQPFDPWLRVHYRLGATFARVCNESMGMDGTVAQWERWSGLRFPVSGQYTVADCLAPVKIDLDLDRGLYIEPNVWMVHPEGEPA